MAQNTAIEWADHTFNPWLGCTKVSPGCDHCYAEAWAKRAGKTAGVVWGGDRRRTSAANWQQPLRWNAQAERESRRFRVFCASLADVFDNEVPVQWRRDLFDLIAATPHIDWLLLTKRIGNARSLYAEAYLDSARQWPVNVWLGATVVDQAEADRDVPKLLKVPARVRFLSVEPMLGPISFDGLFASTKVNDGTNALEALDWVICGGESGPGARPMHPDWARGLRDQCAAAGVPFLFKQWGEWLPADGPRVGAAFGHAHRGDRRSWSWLDNDGSLHERSEQADRQRSPYGTYLVARIGKKAAGRQLDGRTHDEFPQV